MLQCKKLLKSIGVDIYYLGNCYKFVDLKMNWVAASQNCRAQDSYLVSISSESENNFIYGK